MAQEFLQFVRRPTFRPAIMLPSAIVLIFSLFTLSAATDPQRVLPVVSVGIVDLDADSPAALGTRLAAGLDAALPMAVIPFAAEATARGALDEGDVAAVLIIPSGFSAAVAAGDAIRLPVLASQHLSQIESQLATTLPAQLQAVIGGAVAGLASGGEAPAAPTIVVAPELLHAAPNATALVAPPTMLQATWLAALAGSILLFLTTRGDRRREAALPVAILRSAVPPVAFAIAGLVLAFVVCWTTGLWSSFLALWATVWISATGVALLSMGLFSVLGFFAIVILLPTVFYQAALAGAQAPIAALPDWLGWAADLFPFHAVIEGYRRVLIGGPDGWSPWGTMLVVAASGLALIWIGTFLYARRSPVPIAPAA
ncbi:MAG: ABC transporter permease [Bauldia sp.]|nr:ABC transporter permease [Bauldia sp.]